MTNGKMCGKRVIGRQREKVQDLVLFIYFFMAWRCVRPRIETCCRRSQDKEKHDRSNQAGKAVDFMSRRHLCLVNTNLIYVYVYVYVCTCYY